MSIKLVVLAFEKAKKEIGSSKKTHLAQHLSDILLENYGYILNERTLRDYYTNYKNGISGIQEDLKPKLTACLCNYLGYKDYADFILQNKSEKIENPEEGKKKSVEEKKRKLEEERRKSRRIVTISISVAFGMTILILGTQNWPLNFQKNISNESECMTWADSLYVSVSCDESPLSNYGTQVKPLDRMELKNLKKVEVRAGYSFFTEEGKPRIWYYRNKSNEFEYFTAPGLHPTTGETLRKITPYIIKTYVPIHSRKENSFIN